MNYFYGEDDNLDDELKNTDGEDIGEEETSEEDTQQQQGSNSAVRKNLPNQSADQGSGGEGDSDENEDEDNTDADSTDDEGTNQNDNSNRQDDTGDDGVNEENRRDGKDSKDGKNEKDGNEAKENQRNSDEDNQKKSKKENDSSDGNNRGKNSSKADQKDGLNNAGKDGAEKVGEKAGEEAGKKATEEAGKEVGKKVAEEGVKKGAETAVTSGAGTAGGASLIAALGPILIWVLIIIVAIIIIVGIIMFFMTMPGMVMEQLKAFFSGIGKSLANYFLGIDETMMIEDTEVYEVLDYLEEMGYDLKGFGFITKDADKNDADYDSKQGVIRDPDSGKITKAYSDIIFQYIVSDNYAYTAKNFNQTSTFKGLFGIIETTVKNVISEVDIFNLVDTTEWGTGLLTLKIDDGTEDGKAYEKNLFDKMFGTDTSWNNIKINVENKTMEIRRGWGANYYSYNLDGWTGRYSMPLEFLLSVHIATMKPDLTYEMSREFNTDVDIRLKSVTNAYIESIYRTDTGIDISYARVEEEIHQIGKSDNLISAIVNWFDDLVDTPDEVCALIALGIDHVCQNEEDKCDFTGKTKKVKTAKLDENGNQVYEDGKLVEVEVEVKTVESVSSACRDYALKVQEELCKANEYSANLYIPYIKKVTDHWYRDVYWELSAADIASKEFTKIDLDYEKITNERWTLYEIYDENEDAKEFGNYKLYKYDENAEQGIGELYEVDADGDGIKGTQEDADLEGVKVLKKQVTATAEELNSEGLITIANGKWSAYETVNSDASKVGRAYPDAEEDSVKSKIYYREEMKNTIAQKEDGIRGVTNAKIKDMFLNRYYFSYDGTTETANVIAELRKKVGMTGKKKYGEVDSSNLDKEFDVTVEYDDDGDIKTKTETVKVKDYVSQVSLTQDSLAAFSMLENTHTLDADYIYKDFKELIVELGYFTKEELSDGRQETLQWVIPDVGSYGFPIASLDKKENEYGTQVHSKEDYKANAKNTLAEKYAEAKEKMLSGESGEQDVGNGDLESVPNNNLNNVGNITVSDYNPSVEEVIGAMGSDIERIAESGDGYAYKVKVGSVEYTHYYQFDGSYHDKYFTWAGQQNTIHQAGCGPTSCVNILTGYGVDVTPNDMVGITFSGTGDGLVGICEEYGVSTQWITKSTDAEYEEIINQALSEGKPVITLMHAGPKNTRNSDADDFWTTEGHFVAIVGVDSNGNMITIDPGSGQAPRHTYTPGVAGAVKYVDGVLIPDEAPSGARGSSGGTFEGFEGGEAVVSPVTGILLEYGTYEKTEDDLEEIAEISTDSEETTEATEKNRKNSDKKSEVDSVGYAKILVLNEEIANQLVTCSEDRKAELEKEGGTVGKGIVTIDNVLNADNPVEELEKLKIHEKALYGYSLFYEDYKNAEIDGYVVYIDGFKCELPETTNGATTPTEENTTSTGIELSKEYFEQNAAKGSTDTSFISSNYTDTKYEPDEVFNLMSDKIENQQKAKSEAKNIAAPLYSFEGYLGGELQDLLLIKEGTVIGTTMSNKELVESRGETYVAPPAEEEETTEVDNNDTTTETDDKTEVQGNYLRVIMRDLDDTVVENVEEYMKLDEEGKRSSTGEGNFSLIGTVYSKSEFVDLVLEYTQNNDNIDQKWKERETLEELYDICNSKGVNPEYIIARGIQESGLSSRNGNNYWGYNTPNNATELWDGGTWQNVLGLYCDTILEYQDPTTSKYATIMERNDERAACTENGGIDPLGYGTPDTLGGQQSLYSWLGDDHSANNAGAGGMYYLYPWGWGGIQYEGENKIIFESKEEFEQLCGSKHGTSGGKTSSTPTTVWEQGMYTAYQCREIVRLAQLVFGEKAGTY